jgi:hypothetical protein
VKLQASFSGEPGQPDTEALYRNVSIGVRQCRFFWVDGSYSGSLRGEASLSQPANYISEIIEKKWIKNIK